MNLTQANSIIEQIECELREDNDRAERMAELNRMVARVKDDARVLHGIHRAVFPNGTWADADRIHAKLRDMRGAGL